MVARCPLVWHQSARSLTWYCTPRLSGISEEYQLRRFESTTPLWKLQISYIFLQNAGCITHTTTVNKIRVSSSVIKFSACELWYNWWNSRQPSYVVISYSFRCAAWHMWNSQREGKRNETSSCETRLPGVKLTCTLISVIVPRIISCCVISDPRIALIHTYVARWPEL